MRLVVFLLRREEYLRLCRVDRGLSVLRSHKLNALGDVLERKVTTDS